MSVTVWTTKDGTKIPIAEMTDTHLSNAIAHLERKIEATEDAMDSSYRHRFHGVVPFHAAEQAGTRCGERLMFFNVYLHAMKEESNRRRAGA